MINSRHRLFFVNFKPRLFVKLYSKKSKKKSDIVVLLFFFHIIKVKESADKTSVKKIERRGFN